MRTQSIISLTDFRYVCIECPHCHAKVTLDMRQKSEFAEAQGVFAPAQCPGCRKAYDSAIRPNIDAMQRIYADLFEIAEYISFIGEPQP